MIFQVILLLGLKGSYRNKYHNPHLSFYLYSFVKKCITKFQNYMGNYELQIMIFTHVLRAFCSFWIITCSGTYSLFFKAELRFDCVHLYVYLGYLCTYTFIYTYISYKIWWIVIWIMWIRHSKEIFWLGLLSLYIHLHVPCICIWVLSQYNHVKIW